MQKPKLTNALGEDGAILSDVSVGGPKSAPNKVLYLACPYSHKSRAVRERRFRAATKAAASLISQGNIVYSPITMTHPIDVELAGRTNSMGSDYWVTFDKAFMDFCSEIVVLRLSGWDQSQGVSREVDYFKMQGKPVRYMDID